jgi:NADP-dependent 3-hydroxy acid dehydrogenase YdfG
MLPVSEQVVVVTGASAGIGRAIAQALGRKHARVALLARTEEALQHAASEIREAGGQALVLPCDVGVAQAVHHAAQRVVAEWGRIDTWINDAMVSVFSPAKEMTPAEYQRVTEVNYLGTVYGTLAALHHMLPRDRGTIIQIGSALAYRSIPLQSAYCGSKAAIRAFTDSLRCELEHDRSRVRLCMLQLPAVNTPQFDVVRSRLPNQPQPVPPIYQPEVIADAVVYACERAPRELWLGSSAIKAIVGQFFARRFADRYLGRIGYQAQQTKEPALPGRRDDVFQPLPGDRGAHGRFDARARNFNAEIWARIHPGAVAASALALLAVGAGLASARR